MANLSASQKDIRVSLRRKLRNYNTRRDVKKFSKELLIKLKTGDKAGAAALLPKAFSAIDKAVKKHILHKSNAARKKASLNKALVKAS